MDDQSDPIFALCDAYACVQARARLAEKLRKADAKKKAASGVAAAEAKARKAKMEKKKDASKFNQVRRLCTPRGRHPLTFAFSMDGAGAPPQDF